MVTISGISIPVATLGTRRVKADLTFLIWLITAAPHRLDGALKTAFTGM